MVGELHDHFPYSQCKFGSVSASFSHIPCLNLRQGNHTMAQYIDEFSKLSRYAPDDVAIDAAKQEKFMEGLNDEMIMQLMVATFNNYQELVYKALMIEGKQQ